jgi:uncharacterized membrane protein
MKWRIGRSSWAIPATYAAFALAIGILLPRLEYRLPFDLSFGISSASAIAIYSAVATGTMTLLAIVFSLTFVMVQFSATVYSPRLVLWLSEDTLIAHALGINTGAFLYSLSAIAWVDRNNVQGVSLAGAVVAMVWLLASMGAFIALIKRIAALQVSRMLAFTGDRGRQVIATLYASDRPSSEDGQDTGVDRTPSQVVAHHGRPRVVQAIDASALLKLAGAANTRIDVAVAVGDTVMESTPLIRVHGRGPAIAERALTSAIHVGDQRTFEQDPQYAIRLLVDIAIRALSPAINDPTTAVQALDEIGDLLLRLGRTSLATAPLRDAAGVVRVTIPMPTWDDFLRLAFDEICAYGSSSIQVMRRMNALLSELVRALPEPRRAALGYWQHRLEGAINRSFVDLEARRDALVRDPQGIGVSRRSAA